MSFAEEMYGMCDMEDIPGTHEWCEKQFKNIKYLSDDKKKVLSMEYCINCGSTNVKMSKKGKKYCGDICWK